MVETEQKTTLELLEALETAVERRRAAAAGASRGGAERFRREMERIALTAGEFASLFGVSPGAVQEWVAGRSVPPLWAEAAVSLLCQLTPRLRRKVLRRPEPAPAPGGRSEHPFSRIEEL